MKRLGKKKADIKFIKDVLLLFRKDIIKPAEGSTKLNYYGMFKNNFKTAVRNLIRQKGYTAINLFGLTVGTMVTMVIVPVLHATLHRIASPSAGGRAAAAAPAGGGGS